MKYADIEELTKAHLILNTIQDACLEINSSSTIIFANKRAEQLFGREKNKLIGRYLWEVFSEPIQTPGVDAINNALSENIGSQIDYFSPFFQSAISLRCIAIDQGVILLINVKPRKKSSIPASDEDVSVHKESDLIRTHTIELKENRDLLRATIDSSMDMIQVFQVVRNEENEIIDFVWVLNNQTSEKIYGDVIGKSLLTLNPGVVKEGIFDTFKKVVETGEPDQSERHYVHEQFNGWFYQSTVKQGDGVATTTRDITEAKKAEQNIRDSQAFLQTVIDSSLDVIQVFETVRNRAGQIVDFRWKVQNSKGREQNGEVIGRSLLQHNPGVISSGIFERMVQVAETGIPNEQEQYYSYEQFNDQWFYQALVKQDDGVLMTTRDVTKQKRAEQEVLRLKDEIAQKATDKYHTLFNSIDEGFCVIELIYNEQREGVDVLYLETNPSFEKHTGVKNVVGKLGSKVTPNEDYWLKAYDNILRTGEPLRTENYNAYTDRWYSAYLFRISENSNHVAAVFQDITERKRHEANLAFLNEVSSDLEQLVNISETISALGAKIGKHFGLSHCHFVELDQDRKTGVVNYGWQRSDIQEIKDSRRMSDFLSPEFREKMQAGMPVIVSDVWNDPIADGKSLAAIDIGAFLTVPLVRNDDWLYWLGLYHSEAHDWRNDEIELARELTARIWTRLERARAEEALRESEQYLKQLLQQRDDFIGVASHELKTPVTSMKAYAEIVQGRLKVMGNNQDSELLGKLNAQINRLTNLINDLLDITKISEGQLKLTFEPLDVNELLQERIDEIRRTTHHQFELHTEELPPVSADRERIGQVVTNLLSNAIKYSPQETTITVSTRNLTDRIQVSVQDQGYGISEEDQKKIFDRFYRVTANNMDTLPGMGLGLYITAQIIHRHKGTINVKSKPGEGSVFEFTIAYKH